MKILKTIFSNYYLNVAFLSWFAAQLIKTVLTLIFTRKFDAERLVGAGGMPSSHSSFTVAMAVALGRDLGIDSPLFALALAFSAVVMYDAMGVRRAAGEQAKVINRMMFELPEFSLFSNKKQSVEVDLEQENPVEESSKESETCSNSGKKLQEFLGHTPLEVLAGAVLGIVVGFLVPAKS